MSSPFSLWDRRCLLISANSLVNLRSASSQKPNEHQCPLLTFTCFTLEFFNCHPGCWAWCPVCCGCVLMCPIHLSVCLIWMLLVSPSMFPSAPPTLLSPPPPASCSPLLAVPETPRILSARLLASACMVRVGVGPTPPCCLCLYAGEPCFD